MVSIAFLIICVQLQGSPQGSRALSMHTRERSADIQLLRQTRKSDGPADACVCAALPSGALQASAVCSCRQWSGLLW